MDKVTLGVILVVCGLCAIALIYCIIKYLIPYLNKKIDAKYEMFVRENSVAFKKLLDINSKYNFYACENLDQRHTYDKENFYNEISCEDYLIYQLQFIRGKINEENKKIKYNNETYPQYIEEIKSLLSPGDFYAPVDKLNIRRLLAVEKRILINNIEKAPRKQFELTVILCHSNIRGVVYNKKIKTFDYGKIYALIKRLDNKNGNFYNDRGIWDAIVRVERGKVSNKMRFSIYERDGHRCCNCGRSGRYEDLEIDHIIPISKGGKSTYDNLQTLCHKCNVEKGNKMPY